MTEEIIIDGVNVAGCKYYHYKGCTANNLCKCGNSINCYFKQLKRSEQENKELKEKVKSRENELANMAEQANIRINTYRSALEEIKEIIVNHCKACNRIQPEDKIIECKYCNYQKFLDKINEVLGNESN